MDDGGWKKIEDKIQTPSEAMLLVEKSAKKKNPPGWIVDQLKNGYTPPELVPQSSLRRWANELNVISKVCGYEVTERIAVSNGFIFVGAHRVNNSELTPESIEFKESQNVQE